MEDRGFSCSDYRQLVSFLEAQESQKSQPAWWRALSQAPGNQVTPSPTPTPSHLCLSGVGPLFLHFRSPALAQQGRGSSGIYLHHQCLLVGALDYGQDPVQVFSSHMVWKRHGTGECQSTDSHRRQTGKVSVTPKQPILKMVRASTVEGAVTGGCLSRVH